MTAGRPSKFKPEYVEQARKLCLLGATDQALADFWGVAVTTIDNWKKDHPEFLGALKEAKAEADAQVQRRLYERATGYSCPETKVFCSDGKVTTHEVVRHYPPDPTSLIFWLKNRQPQQWRDKQEVEHGFKSGDAAGFTDDELARVINHAGNRGNGAAKKANGQKKPDRLH